jgi:putative addiction module component (TIGR02574 family)
MTTNAQRILTEAMALDPAERTELAERLLGTVDPSTDPGYVAAWGTEIDRRINDLDAGVTNPIPWEKARSTMFGSAGPNAKAD